MSKSMLVMDTPRICAAYQFCENEYIGEEMNKEYVASHCRLNGREIKDIAEKPDWCLLKPLPEKMTGVASTDHWNSIKAGWNGCIDEITGGKK